MINVLIADDHAIVRQGLKQVLSEVRDMRVAGEAADGVEALHKVRTGAYDVLVLDLTMPGQGGFEILKTLQQEQPDLRVLVLSMHAEEQYAVRLLRAGAAGYVTKDSAPEELVQAIRKVVAGGKYISVRLAEILALSPDMAGGRPLHEKLSDREFQVMCLLAAAKTATDIAAELALSVKTITTYRARILEKLNLNNTAEIIHYALRNRLIN